MKRKANYRDGLRATAAAVGMALFIGTATLCASNPVDGAASTEPEGGQKMTVRASSVPVAVMGAYQYQEQETPRFETAIYREPIQTAEPVARYFLDDESRDCVERVVMAEAEGEDFNGQCLVAQCILNTMLARDMSAVDVVREPNQYAAPAAEASESVKAAVDAVFLQGYRVTSEPIRYFYAPRYCYSAWHENSLVFVLEHGGHRFFKEG